MTPLKTAIPGTDLFIQDERLSSLCKIFRKGEDQHFAQFHVQTGVLGEAVIKGFESPKLSFKHRKMLNDAIWSYLANAMGYTHGTLQRVKQKPKLSITTVKKSLIRYKSQSKKVA